MKRLTKKDQTPVYLAPVEELQHDDTHHLPGDPKTKQPIAPMAQPGYYPGYSTLSQQAFWDEATRTTVLTALNRCRPSAFSPRKRRV